MAYRELPPPPELAHLVACLWVRDAGPRTSVRRVLPDACVDLVWTPGSPPLVAGPDTAAVSAKVAAHTSVIGIRFRVGAAGAALEVPAAELRDARLALANLWGGTAERLEERLDTARFPLAELARTLASRGGREVAPDALVRAAAARLARPRATVPAVAYDLGIGERQLRRRFDEAVGYSPKTLQRVLRLQRFLRLAQDPAADLARLALDAGYADQAHLTREVRRLGGLPPAALLASGAGPAGETSDSFKTPVSAPASMAA